MIRKHQGKRQNAVAKAKSSDKPRESRVLGTQRKTFVAVLASHDDHPKNESLAELLNDLVKADSKRAESVLDGYHFLFTGGTFDRLFVGSSEGRDHHPALISNRDTRAFFLTGPRPRATRLPSAMQGGIIVLSYLLTQRQCSLIWSFFTPLTMHWLNPENLALMRLCDTWRVKRLMNSGSVKQWYDKEAERDRTRNLQQCPLVLRHIGGGAPQRAKVEDLRAIVKVPITERDSRQQRPNQKNQPAGESYCKLEPPSISNDAPYTLALIAHDEMKARMIEFAVDYEPWLMTYDRILTTSTTGREVGAVAPLLDAKIKACPCHSGPKGGDIEIATEILYGRCHDVIFFVDPLHPHPHTDDIRAVFGACMLQDDVRMFTNEMQAREWAERVLKRAKN